MNEENQKVLVKRVWIDLLDGMIQALPLKENIIHVLHYRLLGKTLDEIAHDMGKSRERVRQLEAHGLRMVKFTRFKMETKWRWDGSFKEVKKWIAENDPPPEVVLARVKTDLLWVPIEALELTVRAAMCLKHADIKTIGELVQKTEAEIFAMKNMGKITLQEIKNLLREMGLQLGMKVFRMIPEYKKGEKENG